MILEKKIFKFRQCISLFCNYLPLERGGALLLNKLKSPSPRDAFSLRTEALRKFFFDRPESYSATHSKHCMLLATVGPKFIAFIYLHLRCLKFYLPLNSFILLRNKLDNQSAIILHEGKQSLNKAKKCYFYLTKLFLNLILYYLESMSKTNVVINQTILPSCQCMFG